MSMYRDLYGRAADRVRAFAEAKRSVVARGSGAYIVPPKRVRAAVGENSFSFAGADEGLSPADRQIKHDFAAAARAGAMTGLVGAMVRRSGQDATIGPTAKRERERVPLTPFLANAISREIHARYGSEIGDDFDRNYLRETTVTMPT